MPKFPFFTAQQFNLDWVMLTLKKILAFMPIDKGTVGDVLQRKANGAAWEPLSAVSMDIHGLQTAEAVADDDEIPIYDKTATGNRKVTVAAIRAGVSSPVTSVNGQTGSVLLDADDVGALPDDYTPPVTSVNGQTGAVVLDAADVGALPDTQPVADLYYTSGYKSLTTAVNPTLDVDNDCTILAGGVKYQTSADKKTIRLCGSLRIECGSNTGWRTFEITGADIADFRAGVNEIVRDFSCEMYEDITPARQLWIFAGSTFVNYRIYADKTIRLFVNVSSGLVGKTIYIVFHGDPFQIA